MDTPPTEPTLHAVSSELAAAAALALKLEGTISELVSHLGHRSGDPAILNVLLGLQDLDQLAQTLEDLSRFVMSLAREEPAGRAFDAAAAASGLRLRALALKLVAHQVMLAGSGSSSGDDVLL